MWLHAGCLKKKRYSSWELAEKVKNRAKHQRQIALSVYSCQTCSGWHLTSQVTQTPVPAAVPSPAPKARRCPACKGAGFKDSADPWTICRICWNQPLPVLPPQPKAQL